MTPEKSLFSAGEGNEILRHDMPLKAKVNKLSTRTQVILIKWLCRLMGLSSQHAQLISQLLYLMQRQEI
jgi:hypothetical protein